MGRFIDRIRERRENRRFNRSFNKAMENAYGDNYYMTPDVRGYHENAFRNGPEAFNEAVETVKFRNAHPRTASQSRFVEDNDADNIRYVMLEKARQSLSAINPSSMNPIARQETDMDVWNRRASELSGGRLKNIADVVAFQKENGLVADGKLGAKTLAVLNGLNKKDNTKQSAKKRFNKDDIAANRELGNVDIFPEKEVQIPEGYNGPYDWNSMPTFGNAPISSSNTTPIVEKNYYANGRNKYNDGSAIMQLINGISDRFNNWVESNRNNPNYRPLPSTATSQYRNVSSTPMYQSGGSMNNQEFIKYLAECTGATDEQSLKKAIKTLGEKGINALKEMFNKGVPASEVKKRISGQSQYMKKGGCLSCEGKMARFAKASKPELKKIVAHANVNTISTLKCGGKAKKKMIKKSK